MSGRRSTRSRTDCIERRLSRNVTFILTIRLKSVHGQVNMRFTMLTLQSCLYDFGNIS